MFYSTIFFSSIFLHEFFVCLSENPARNVKLGLENNSNVLIVLPTPSNESSYGKVYVIAFDKNSSFLKEPPKDASTESPKDTTLKETNDMFFKNPYKEISNELSTIVLQNPPQDVTFKEAITFFSGANFTLPPNTTFFAITENAENAVLPEKGTKEEINHSLKILLILFVIAACFLLIHLMLKSNFHYLPESIVVILIGALFGSIFKFFPDLPGNFERKQAFDPTTFFLFLLPPIMYESGYNLHKGNFFKNIGSILIFAIVGTAISAFIIGGGLYLLGLTNVVYRLSFAESFAFGSFISAVDPVATLAIFHALDVDPVLSMLVTGESILNDAVSIVLASSVWKASHQHSTDVKISDTIIDIAMTFTYTFFVSAIIGVLFALVAAILFKHVALRNNPSLEFGMMLIFIYAPYCLAEGLQLSGIMAILFNGIVMSHYTHFNLSRVAQEIMQVTLRTMAFIAETCVFAYLGLAMFSFRLIMKPSFLFSSVMLCLVGRAFNIYPLSFLVNIYREHKITTKMMFVMWFSGIRGAVSFALALRFDFEDEKRNVIVTSTLIIVLLTTIVLGGGTMPLLKLLHSDAAKLKREDGHSEICLSKTEKMGRTIDADMLSEDENSNFQHAQKGFLKIDNDFLVPFFTRKPNSRQGSETGSRAWTRCSKDWYKVVTQDAVDEYDST